MNTFEIIFNILEVVRSGALLVLYFCLFMLALKAYKWFKSQEDE